MKRISGAIIGSIKTELLCVYCNTNEARLITEFGAFACAVCCEGRKVDAIRISDVSSLLKWARGVQASYDEAGEFSFYAFDALNDLIGQKP